MRTEENGYDERAHRIAGISRRSGVPDNCLAHLGLHRASEPGVLRWKQSIRTRKIIDEFDRLLTEPNYIPDYPLADVARVERVEFPTAKIKL